MKLTLTTFVLLLAFVASPLFAQSGVRGEIPVELLVAPADIPPIPSQPAPEDGEQPDAEEPTEDPEPTTPTPAEQPKPNVLKFHLMDGTIITGKLTTKSIPVSTDFGDLTVPIDAIASFAPGLGSHPEIDKTIDKLINDLGNPDAKTRDKAQAELLAYGPGLISELQANADDPDAERRVRIATITEELLSIETDDFGMDQGPSIALTRLDQIVTERFTIAGKIMQDQFTIASNFGELNVKLKDIKAVQRVSTDKPEIRKTVAVAGSDMTCRNYKKTGIRVNRGDRIIIAADGRITMSPWGSNSVSGPDGIPQNGMYNGQIPMGALAGRIGDSGEEFLVGSKASFVAKKTGILQLGFAMQQNWANYQFPGEYKTRIRVVPAE